MLTAALLAAASVTTPLWAGPREGGSGTPAAKVVSATSAQGSARKKAQDKPIRDLSGQIIGYESQGAAALGGRESNPFASAVSATPFLYRVWEVTLTISGSMWEEKFLIGVPKVPLAPAPLLVAFHGWGSSHHDISFHTKYFQRAMARGWVVVAPLGAHKFNYSIDYSQDNTEAVLDWVVQHFDIDWERIYGVGFSMGGGCVSTYAARHLDPTGPRFAAIIDHTGTVSIEDVWTHAANKSLLEHDLMFQGPPARNAFRYQQASVVDIDAGGQIDPNADLSRNIVHLPTKVFAAAGDPQQHLVTQSTLFHGWLSGLGGDATLEIVSGNTHSWSTLSETEALDWLQQFVLLEPLPGVPVKVLADRNASWWGFQITQDRPGVFSPFRWTTDLQNNRLILDLMSNAAAIRFDAGSIGLDDGSTPVQVMINLINGDTEIEMVLEGYPQSPTSVVRTGTNDPDWSWNAQDDTVTLHETYGIGYPRWTVTR